MGVKRPIVKHSLKITDVSAFPELSYSMKVQLRTFVSSAAWQWVNSPWVHQGALENPGIG